jgi:excisionase family DNA binding protein
MRGLGDFQRRQMKRGDPRVHELFSHLRQIIDLLEDIVIHRHQQPEVPLQPSSPTPKHQVTTAVPLPQAATAQTSTPILVSIKEASRLIGIGNTRIYELINVGALETMRIGRRRMIRYSSIQNFVDS